MESILVDIFIAAMVIYFGGVLGLHVVGPGLGYSPMIRAPEGTLRWRMQRILRAITEDTQSARARRIVVAVGGIILFAMLLAVGDYLNAPPHIQHWAVVRGSRAMFHEVMAYLTIGLVIGLALHTELEVPYSPVWDEKKQEYLPYIPFSWTGERSPTPEERLKAEQDE